MLTKIIKHGIRKTAACLSGVHFFTQTRPLYLFQLQKQYEKLFHAFYPGRNAETVEIFEQDQADFNSFAAIVRKYVGIRELTPTIVNEFVKKIIVHAPDKSSGHRRQEIEFAWNFIGELEQDEDKQTVERQRKSRTA